MAAPRAIIAITCDVDQRGLCVRRTYVEAVTRAGGVAILVGPAPGDDVGADELVRAHLDLCHGVVLSGGDDPATEAFGAATHPQARRICGDRQRYETALLRALEDRPEMPALGVCLGMQMMALVAGGALDQFMPVSTPTHADHADGREHEVVACAESSVLLSETIVEGETIGRVSSRHRQAVSDAGSLRIVARAHDGVIEAIDDPERRFYLGVQWHPERTSDRQTGGALFERLVEAARAVALCGE